MAEREGRLLRPYYKLEGKIPVPATLDDWSQMIERRQHVLWHDEVGDWLVSTVFLGIDHNFSCSGPPVLFETMIFTRDNNEYQERTTTWELAREQHLAALARALFA